MADLDKVYLFRMTHIKNIPHILQFGITHVSSPNANPNFEPIGDSSIISTRNAFELENGKKLGIYIPFYFGVRMPMLYVIQNGYNGVKSTKAEEIVYLVTSVNQVINHNLNFVFTDGHAIEALSSLCGISDVENIENILDFAAIRDPNWIDLNYLGKKRMKQAEFLVENDIPNTAILGFAVSSDASKTKLISFGIPEENIVIKKEYYF